MKRFTIALAALAFSSVGVLADEKPSDEEASKIKDALTAWGCSGGEYEKEVEGSGLFEVDDAECKDGQFDIKLDKDFKILSATRD